jgi:hypothetical protein
VERKALRLGHAVLVDRGANANRCMPITGSAPPGPSIDCAGLTQKLCVVAESLSSTHSPPPSSPSSPSSSTLHHVTHRRLVYNPQPAADRIDLPCAELVGVAADPLHRGHRQRATYSWHQPLRHPPR